MALLLHFNTAVTGWEITETKTYQLQHVVSKEIQISVVYSFQSGRPKLKRAKGHSARDAKPSFLFYDNKIQCCRHTSSTPCYFLFGMQHQSSALVPAQPDHTSITR